MNQFAPSILAMLDSSVPGCRLFLDHAVLALHAHFARVYGQMRIDSQPTRGGLAPWQIRRATNLLMSHLDGSIALSRVADECSLSISHFVRAFKQSVGLPPYRWLLEQRVKVAQNLLQQSPMPMVEIAANAASPIRPHSSAHLSAWST